MNQLELNFGAIDLILRSDNEYSFREENAVGELYWLYVVAGLWMSDAADVLMDGSMRRI